MGRKVVLMIEDDAQFIELYSMAKSFLKNSTVPDHPVHQIMEQLNEKCEAVATIDERIEVNRIVEVAFELINQESPDVYLLRAGMAGIAEDFQNKMDS